MILYIEKDQNEKEYQQFIKNKNIIKNKIIL